MQKINQKQWETEFYNLLKTCSPTVLEEFLKNSGYQNFNKNYQQSVMDHLVCQGYKNAINEDLAKWALTTTSQDIKGNIHENADRPLRLASQFNVNFAKYLLTSVDLQEKADINATNDGSSALLSAIKSKNLAFIKYLMTSSELKEKAKINVDNKEYNDPLCKACEINDTEIIKYLLSNEAYSTQSNLTPQLNLARFSFASINKIIHNNNVDALDFIISNKLINIKSHLHDFFCTAVKSDCVNIANYLEQFFETKPNLRTMKDNNNSLLFSIIQRNHYSRIHNHSYLNSMLKDALDILSPDEIEKCQDFYIYDENTSVPIKKFLNRNMQKQELEALLPVNHFKKTKRKL